MGFKCLHPLPQPGCLSQAIDALKKTKKQQQNYSYHSLVKVPLKTNCLPERTTHLYLQKQDGKTRQKQ